jgi:hypothetical protein
MMNYVEIELPLEIVGGYIFSLIYIDSISVSNGLLLIIWKASYLNICQNRRPPRKTAGKEKEEKEP